jgi:hypothetical protein
METCPHCLNRGGTAGQCGIVGDRSYDDNLNILGQPMDPSPQARYSQGDEIEVDVILTAHHMGHFEFNACPIETGGIAAGDCFAQHPLTFVSDPLYGAPKDAMYPNRAYIAPTGRATTSNNGTPETRYVFRLKLPDNLAGDLVLLQWHYFTANSCTYPGYDTYAFPADWGNMQSGTEICKTISPDGNGAPGKHSFLRVGADFTQSYRSSYPTKISLFMLSPSQSNSGTALRFRCLQALHCPPHLLRLLLLLLNQLPLP